MLIAARNAMLAGGAAPGPTPAYWGLCFTAEQANSTVAMSKNGGTNVVSVLYSANPADPTSWTTFPVDGTVITLNTIGDKIWLKAGEGGNKKFGQNVSYYYNFSLTGRVAASGSIMSLLNGDEQTVSFSDSFTFYRLFSGCGALSSPPELPATTLSNSCYRMMFSNCTSLTSTPYLPATTLRSSSYRQMFSGCTSLATVHTAQTQAWGDGGASTDPNYNWLSSVAATGTFYCPVALGTNDTITRGTSSCPNGWTVINTDAA